MINTRKIEYALSSAPDTILESYIYVYDKNGNIIKENHKSDYHGATKVNETRDYVYDSLGRLTDSTQTKNGTISTNSYGYDKTGNRRYENTNGDITWMSYNGLNQMENKKNNVGVITATFAYNSNGNQVKEVSGDVTKTLSYDSENRLTEIKKGDIVINTNTYRGDGQRISKTEKRNTTYYTYHDGQVLFTSDTNKKKTSFNLYSPDGGIISSKRYDGSNAGEFLSYTKDVRGSSSTILGEDGNYLISYDYTDFGETTKQGDSTVFNEIAYTGGIYDDSTELYYLNARYYDPANSRFLSQDSYRGDKLEPQSLHLYSYVENDPINFIDPSGHKKVEVDVGLSYKYKRSSAAASFKITFYTKKDNQGKYRLKVKKPKVKAVGRNGFGVTKSYTEWKNRKYSKILVMNHDYYWYDKIYVVKAITVWDGTTVKAFMNFALQLHGKPRLHKGKKQYFSNSSWVEKG